MRDQIYAQKQDTLKSFEFNQQVVEVFDDMLSRSIPRYTEILSLSSDLIYSQPIDQHNIFDLGCSNGNMLLALNRRFDNKNFQYTGIDSSLPMIEQCRKRQTEISTRHQINFRIESIEETSFDNATSVVAHFILQFIAPEKRLLILQKIFQELPPQGIFILSEKVLENDKIFSEVFAENYYRFKKLNGYSELEIAQKRQALENILIPLTVESQIEMLKQSGFQQIAIAQKWLNFATFVAQKI